MPTLVFDPQPGVIEELIAERERLGLDRRDEVWEGVLHMIPPPSVRHEVLAARLVRVLGPLADGAGLSLTGPIGIGTPPHDYRVPDLTALRAGYEPQWNVTAALVVEILSPGDKSREKLPFYAAHHVDEVLIVDPDARRVDWLTLADGEYRPIERSALLNLTPAQLAAGIDWPA